MGKDNSCSKSKLQIQRERMNEELINFSSSITRGLRTIEDSIKIQETVRWIIGLYKETSAKMKENLIITERVLDLKAENHIDLSEHNKTLSELNKGLKESEYEKIEKQYIEKIKPQIISRMDERMNVILDKLNEVVVDYTFYLKSIEINNIYFGDYDFKLNVTFRCKIDIV